jgi:hypothetical protein
MHLHERYVDVVPIIISEEEKSNFKNYKDEESKTSLPVPKKITLTV